MGLGLAWRSQESEQVGRDKDKMKLRASTEGMLSVAKRNPIKEKLTHLNAGVTINEWAQNGRAGLNALKITA